jgi:hypothetical protein
LTTNDGNADLLAYVQNFESKDQKDWSIPSDNSKTHKSFEKLTSDVIQFKKQDFEKHCSSAQCLISFAVRGSAKAKSSYHFVVYKEFTRLLPRQPQTGYVAQDSWMYFTYYNPCEKCSVLISATTYSTGDPDIYVTYSDSKLPTKEDNDFQSASFKSENLEITLQD